MSVLSRVYVPRMGRDAATLSQAWEGGKGRHGALSLTHDMTGLCVWPEKS